MSSPCCVLMCQAQYMVSIGTGNSWRQHLFTIGLSFRTAHCLPASLYWTFIESVRFHKTLLQVLACSVSIKYGIWAVVMISHYWASGGALEATEAMLWISHLGMAVEGAVFLRVYSFGRAGAFVAAAWMLLNDLMDYGAGLHPISYGRTEYLASDRLRFLPYSPLPSGSGG